MVAAVVGLVVAIVALVAAAATITAMAIRGADLQVKLGAALLRADVEAGNAAAARADLADYRARAGIELANLRADLEAMADAPHVVDPVVRRARWDELLRKIDAAGLEPAAGPAPAAGDVLPGLAGGQPAARPAGGGAAGPGPGRTPA